ncbi:hypothetical protein [Roseisolibacter sp. H3M3-2]|uniref:hypothetical protein n=1 Tax=Roseisolibacter sp. H3M3-2 TaxID=3031323 RepID=UPI0023DB82F6|nr:hypothetical protein [Roseisolibacter sp. H3M3-2]MDF1503445.1 hypothetical protein [Roseisolibacter sp. H3M3-2]
MSAPLRTAPAPDAEDRYVRSMRPIVAGEGFDRDRAAGAIVTFVRDLEAAHAPAASIVRASVDLLPIHPDARDTVWAISLRDWAATTARETLRLPLLDRRSALRAGVGG